MKVPKRDQNWTLQGGPLLISSGSTFWPFFKHVSSARGPKNGPSAGWIRCLLEGPVLSPPLHLLPLPCSNVETHQHHTNQHWVGNKGLEQGRPPLRFQKSYQFQVQKTNPKTSLLYLLVLIMTTCPFLLCWCKRSRASKACNRGALRLGEAWARPGEAWARPRFERKTYWHKDKARLMGTRNYIILLLKSQEGWTWSSWCLCCLARILSRSWRKGTASRQGSRPQGYGNCSQPKKVIGWNKVGGRPQCKSSTPVSQDHGN